MTHVSSWQAVRILALALLVALSGISRAQPADTAARIDRLLDAAGIAHSIRQILPNMLSGINAEQQGLPPSLHAAIVEAATQAFQPAPMLDTTRSRLSANLGGKELDDTLAWLDSPLGRRITALENTAAEPAAVDAMGTYVKELEQRPPAKSRVGLIVELNALTGAAEMTATIIEGIALATVLGINAALPAEKRPPLEALRKQLAVAMPNTREQAAQMVTIYGLYAYRALSDEDLAAYVRFVKSPSGAAYAKAALVAFNDSMLEALGRFMQALPKAIDKHKGALGT